MDYGAKGLLWAPFADADPEPAGDLPNYGEIVSLGPLIKVSESPQMAEARASGDNAVNRVLNRFTRNNLTVEVNEFLQSVAASLFGATVSVDNRSGETKNLHFRDTDNAPYGGFSFYVTTLEEGNVTKHYGVFYPKNKAVLQGKTYDTSGETVKLNSASVGFTGLRCNTGDWKIVSALFDTEDAAAAWCRQMLTKK